MTLARKHRITRPLIGAAATVVGLVALHATMAGAAPRVSSQTAVGAAAAARPRPTVSASPTAASGGDIAVSVPPVPSQHALPGLCTAFLAGQHRGHEFDVLIGATGGSVAKTTAWCTTYLQYRARGPR